MNTSRLSMALLLAMLAGCASLGQRGTGAERDNTTLARQLLVTTPQTAGASVALLGDPGTAYARRRAYGPSPSVDRILDDIAEDYTIRRVRGWYMSALGEYCEVFEIGSEQNLEELVDRIGADPRVSLAQEMNVFETQAIRYDDPYSAMQPALAELAIGSAHEMATGAGVTVAVIDSSVDSRHPEYRGRVRVERDLAVDHPMHGPEVHGTAIAGIIGSTANNGEGIVGVAPQAQIASLRACWTIDSGSGLASCSSFSLAQALESAIRLDVDVINLSLSGPDDPLLGQLIDKAIERGTIVVAAVPDSESNDDSFPSSHAHVIAVESSESIAKFASPYLLRAPGEEIVSTVPNDGYAFFSGNSMSAAYIAGIAALIRQRQPGIGADKMFELLRETAGGVSVNACRAIARAAEHGECPATGD